jgi:hypothetical protein
MELDAYVARERAAAEEVHEDTQRHAEETRILRAESARVNAQGKRIVEANGFTTWLTHVIRGVQEDGR